MPMLPTPGSTMSLLTAMRMRAMRVRLPLSTPRGLTLMEVS